MITAEQAKQKASELVALYPLKNNVQDLIDQAKLDGHFANETELLAVWGRVLRLLPQKVTRSTPSDIIENNKRIYAENNIRNLDDLNAYTLKMRLAGKETN
jgi:hypothetical protein